MEYRGQEECGGGREFVMDPVISHVPPLLPDRNEEPFVTLFRKYVITFLNV